MRGGMSAARMGRGDKSGEAPGRAGLPWSRERAGWQAWVARAVNPSIGRRPTSGTCSNTTHVASVNQHAITREDGELVRWWREGEENAVGEGQKEAAQRSDEGVQSPAGCSHRALRGELRGTGCDMMM